MLPRYRIGEFARICQVPEKTLRYYDEIGLLRPAASDNWTNYRYYEADQLERLNQILALKDLGFTLAEIDSLLRQDIPIAQMQELLKRKQDEVQATLVAEQARLARITWRLQELGHETGKAPAPVVLRVVPPQMIASIRSALPPTETNISGLIRELTEKLCAHSRQVRYIKPAMCLRHWMLASRTEEIEVAVQYTGEMPADALVTARQTVGVAQMACIIHHGPVNRMYLAYDRMHTWLQAFGYTVVGPKREVYLGSAHAGGGPDDWMAELQWPVARCYQVDGV